MQEMNANAVGPIASRQRCSLESRVRFEKGMGSPHNPPAMSEIRFRTLTEPRTLATQAEVIIAYFD